MLLVGNVAVISGAAGLRGTGMATARLFAEHGARVVILDLDRAASDAAARELGITHRGFACNVTKQDATRRAADAVLGAFGRVDVLINNAGVTQPVKIMEINP